LLHGPDSPPECPFRDIGCAATFADPLDLQAHLQGSVAEHLTLALAELTAVQRQQREQKRRHEDHTKRQQRLILALSDTIVQLEARVQALEGNRGDPLRVNG